uniref:Uncharacterized protein n=1 Tax=Anguilla anguilla TaxID=7936 RepID=A0A0E9PFG3_ANGAN
MAGLQRRIENFRIDMRLFRAQMLYYMYYAANDFQLSQWRLSSLTFSKCHAFTLIKYLLARTRSVPFNNIKHLG